MHIRTTSSNIYYVAVLEYRERRASVFNQIWGDSDDNLVGFGSGNFVRILHSRLEELCAGAANRRLL